MSRAASAWATGFTAVSKPLRRVTDTARRRPLTGGRSCARSVHGARSVQPCDRRVDAETAHPGAEAHRLRSR